jgi:hypothetical protein
VVEAYAYVGSSETVWHIDDGTTAIRATLDPGGARVAIEDDGVDGFALADLHGAGGVHLARRLRRGAVGRRGVGRTGERWTTHAATPSPSGD